MNKRFQILLPVITTIVFFMLCVLLFGIPEKAAYSALYGFGMPLVLASLAAVMLTMALLYKVITVKGLRMRWYLLSLAFFALLLIVFFKTVSHEARYRFFDPFLQMPPTLEPSFFSHKNSNEIRILALGGSTTACKDLPMENRYPYLLQKKLQDSFPDKKITVYNAGQEWYTTRHSHITYTHYYHLFDADIVLVMHAINDLYRSFTPLEYSKPTYSNDYSHFFGAASHAAIPKKSYIHHTMEKLGLFWHKTLCQKNDILCDFPVQKYRSLSSYEYFYHLLITSIQAKGSLPVIISQPFLYKDEMSTTEQAQLWIAREFCHNQTENNYKAYGRKIASVKSLKEAIRTFNNNAKQIALAHNIPFIPLEEAIDKNLTFFSDDVHYTSQGAEKVAEIICNFVIENNIIK